MHVIYRQIYILIIIGKEAGRQREREEDTQIKRKKDLIFLP